METINATDILEVAELNMQVPELMRPKEVGEELGVRANNIDAVPDLPNPCQAFEGRSGRIWRADVIRAFAAERRRRKAAR